MVAERSIGFDYAERFREFPLDLRRRFEQSPRAPGLAKPRSAEGAVNPA